MPNTVPNVTISDSSSSDYVNTAIPIDTVPSFHFFSERNGYSTLTVDDLRQVTDEINDAQIVSGSLYETGCNDIFFQTSELNTSLKELMNRIYKLEIEVYELKQQLNQGGTIKL